LTGRRNCQEVDRKKLPGRSYQSGNATNENEFKPSSTLALHLPPNIPPPTSFVLIKMSLTVALFSDTHVYVLKKGIQTESRTLHWVAGSRKKSRDISISQTVK
jgi:hypothetical protein